MSTGAFENWHVVVEEIGPIYPIVGAEGVWVVVAIVFWFWWQAAQKRIEQMEFAQVEDILEEPERLSEILELEQEGG